MTSTAPLPELLEEFASIVGRENALLLAKARGGFIAQFPREPGPRCWITQAIGQEQATLLCRHITGDSGNLRLEIPRGPEGDYLAARIARQKIIREAFEDGKSGLEIARLAGISRRSAQRQVAKLRTAAARKPKVLA